MSKLLVLQLGVTLALSLPATALAGSVLLMPTGPAQTAGFKPVDGAASGNGAAGYWDNKSYDSWKQGAGSACNAAAIVAGGTCDWKGFPEPTAPAPYQNLTNPRTADPGSLQYYGRTDGAAPDTPENFYFTGPWALELEVLFQLSAWDDTVEFGWYEAGNPDARTPLLPKAGNPSGPYSDNLGTIDPAGRTSASIPTNFGFYYRNTRYGTSPTDEILFFTESQFNSIGNYFGYFSDPHSGLWLNTPLRQEFGDDETPEQALLARSNFDLYAARTNRQQFALFTDNSGRYWLGLEDQVGDITSAFCEQRDVQPCSDYDHNDLILSFTDGCIDCPDDPPVPEPTVLALLAGGLSGVVWLRRRRR